MLKKIKKYRFKITAVILTAVFILSMYAMTITMTMTATGSNAAAPYQYQMFANDRAIMGTLVRDEGRFFVPYYIFYHVNVIMKSSDHFVNHVSIERNNKYVTFNIEAGKAYNEKGEEVDCPAKLIRNQPYISAYAISTLLGLATPEWKGGVLRIKDYTAVRTMDEMLQTYAPKAVTTTAPVPATTTITIPPPTEPPTTTIRNANLPPDNPNNPANPNNPNNPNIAPEITSEIAEIETTTPENTRTINNYLMFDTGSQQANLNNSDNSDNSGDSETLVSLLNFLDEHEIRAIFFLTYEEIAANPGRLREIFASGHGIGIKIDRSDYEDANGFVNEADAANAYIYSLVKQKSRIYRFTADFEDVEYMKDCAAALKRAGYYPCPKHINPEPEYFENIDVTIDFLKQRQVNLFAFNLDLDNFENNYQYLKFIELTAQAVNTKFYINFSHINNANISNLR